jgi:starch-binding outer membrane protein, SusD/RagB family
MKRNIFYPIAICFLVLLSSSCENALEPEIYSQLTDDNFPKTEKDINLQLTSIYSQFTHDWATTDPSNGARSWGVYSTMFGWLHTGEGTTDEMLDTWDTSLRFAWGSAYDTYDNLYSKIKFVSRASEFIISIEDAQISESLKKSSLAEAKVLRAWLMFLLYDWYGPVSVKITQEQIAFKGFEERPTKEQYLQYIINDLTEAMADLADKTNGTENWGKVNKGVARLLLMKIYMNDHQYDKAKVECQALMAMGYTLQAEYKNVFINEGNNEVIWAVPSGEGYNNYWFSTNMPWDCKKINGIEVQQGWSGFYMPWSFYDTYPTGDKRLETIGSSYETFDGQQYEKGTANEGWDLPKGAIVIKYLVPNEQNKAGNFSTVGMRYADVLLSMAEIENELAGPAAGYAYLKQVTDRAGITIPATFSDKDSFSEFLLAERGRELYWEGWRRQDLIRFDKYIEYGQDRGYPAQDHMVMFPIPPSVITESGGIVDQNPGYN